MVSKSKFLTLLFKEVLNEIIQKSSSPFAKKIVLENSKISFLETYTMDKKKCQYEVEFVISFIPDDVYEKLTDYYKNEKNIEYVKSIKRFYLIDGIRIYEFIESIKQTFHEQIKQKWNFKSQTPFVYFGLKYLDKEYKINELYTRNSIISIK